MKMQRHTNLSFKIIVLFIILALAIGALTVYLLSQNIKSPETTTNKLPKTTVEVEKKPEALPTLSFSAMGDMLAHDSVVNQAKTDLGYDFKLYFEKIKPLFAGSDVIFCNPETPSTGQAHGISGYPTFNAPREFAGDLRSIGCNVINLATNHIADKGNAALQETVEMWNSEDVLAVHGANKTAEDQAKVSYFTKNGIKVAFVAFADFSNAAPPAAHSINFYHNKELVNQLLTEARKEADFVVVSAHWGTEDSHDLNQSQRTVAQEMADLGADVIIGTGPHVLQPVEKLGRQDGGETLVWYSIGNMLSSQLQVDQLTGGVAKFKVTKKNDKVEISDIAFETTFMSYEWNDTDRAASRLETRKNLRLEPLGDAAVGTGHFGVTVDERKQKVRQWLGEKDWLTIKP